MNCMTALRLCGKKNVLRLPLTPQAQSGRVYGSRVMCLELTSFFLSMRTTLSWPARVRRGSCIPPARGLQVAWSSSPRDRNRLALHVDGYSSRFSSISRFTSPPPSYFTIPSSSCPPASPSIVSSLALPPLSSSSLNHVTPFPSLSSLGANHKSLSAALAQNILLR